MAVILELAAHLGQLLGAQGELAVLAAGIVDVEDPLAVAEALGADGAAAGVEGGAMEERAAEDIGERGGVLEEAVQAVVIVYHLYR